MLLAHGLVQRADLPIPEWLFGWAAALVLIVSFVALAVLWPEPKLTGYRWRPLPGPLGRVPGSRPVEIACGAIGVVLLTEPWHGAIDLAGVAFALAAAVCWAAYILLTQKVGDELTGLRGLAVSMPVAAVVASLVAGPSVFGHLTWDLVAIGLGLAVLLPVVPFSLELLALRRLTVDTFGTLMSLEPAIAAAVGFVVLGQAPGLIALLGVALVVAAGVGVTLQPGRTRQPVAA